jgi:hypothetical protein
LNGAGRSGAAAQGDANAGSAATSIMSSAVVSRTVRQKELPLAGFSRAGCQGLKPVQDVLIPDGLSWRHQATQD